VRSSVFAGKRGIKFLFPPHATCRKPLEIAAELPCRAVGCTRVHGEVSLYGRIFDDFMRMCMEDVEKWRYDYPIMLERLGRRK
jgi:hypothetical protein